MVTSQPSTGSSHFVSFLLCFLLFISSVQISSPAGTNTTTKTYTNYLKTACNSTTYPPLCYKSLSVYASTIKTNDLQLCNTALNVSLKAATSASTMVKKISKQNLTKIEAGIVKTCIDEVGDVIYELKESMKTMGSLNGSSADSFPLSSIKTWVSAALTDETTCTDELNARKVNPLIKSKIAKGIHQLAELTSIALALINKINYTS